MKSPLRALLLLTVAFLSVSQVHGQLFPLDGVWLCTDSAPSDYQFIGRHALVSIDCNHSSRGMLSLADEIEEIQDRYPWVSFCILHKPSRLADLEANYVKKQLDALDIDIITLVDTSQTHILPIEKRSNIRFSLIKPEGSAVMENIAWTVSGRQRMEESLREIEADYDRPGRVLSDTYFPRVGTALSSLRLLDHSRYFIFENRQQRLVISDTGNDRVLVMSADGSMMECIGSGNNGAELGEFDLSELNRPMGLAFLTESNQILFSDHGNSRLLLADLASRQISELELLDEDGYAISMPSGATDINVQENTLTITMPLAQRVWVIDMNSRRLKEEIGTAGDRPFYHRKASKLVLGHPIAALTIENNTYVYDEHAGTLFSIIDSRVEPIWSTNEQLVEESGGYYAEGEYDIVSLITHENELHLVDGLKGEVIAIDPKNINPRNLEWNTDSIAIGSITDIAWSKNAMYLLDSEFGEVINIENGNIDRLRWDNVSRMNAPAFADNQLIALPSVSIQDSAQTELKLNLMFSGRHVLHPSYQSNVFVSGGKSVYVENEDISKGPIHLITMKDFSKNQINLHAEIYFTEIASPWKVYKRFVQIMIPIDRIPGTEPSMTLDVDLMEGLNLDD